MRHAYARYASQMIKGLQERSFGCTFIKEGCPYGSIASGRLTSDWPRTTHHFETDSFQNDKYDPITNKDQLAVQP